jgi:hypothetical protein
MELLMKIHTSKLSIFFIIKYNKLSFLCNSFCSVGPTIIPDVRVPVGSNKRRKTKSKKWTNSLSWFTLCMLFILTLSLLPSS